MSISTLATNELIRTEGQFLQEQAKPRVDEISATLIPKLNLTAPQADMLISEGLFPLAKDEPVKSGAASAAFDALVKYIPTEVITLYVAAVSILPALKQTFPVLTEACVYWFFVVFTPVLFLVILLGKRREAKLDLFPPLRHWPWWKLVASTIAFSVWSLAIPGNPYLHGDLSGGIAAFGALLVSTFLTLLQPIFEDA